VNSAGVPRLITSPKYSRDYSTQLQKCFAVMKLYVPMVPSVASELLEMTYLCLQYDATLVQPRLSHHAAEPPHFSLATEDRLK
jgi:hypothetical protein